MPTDTLSAFPRGLPARCPADFRARVGRKLEAGPGAVTEWNTEESATARTMGWCQAPVNLLVFRGLFGTIFPPLGAACTPCRTDSPLGERLSLAPLPIPPSVSSDFDRRCRHILSAAPMHSFGGADRFSRRRPAFTSAAPFDSVGTAVCPSRRRRFSPSALPYVSFGAARPVVRHSRPLSTALPLLFIGGAGCSSQRRRRHRSVLTGASVGPAHFYRRRRRPRTSSLPLRFVGRTGPSHRCRHFPSRTFPAPHQPATFCQSYIFRHGGTRV